MKALHSCKQLQRFTTTATTDDYADELFRYMVECHCCRHIRGRKNPRGGGSLARVYSVNANVAVGEYHNASVDGPY